MIESQFWRNELKVDIQWLRVKQRYKRWSEKQMVLFERKLILVAFQVRTLLERPKVNDAARTLKLNGIKYPKVGQNPFTLVGAGMLEDRYDMFSPESVQLSVMDVCNQLVHHYMMAATSKSRGIFDLLHVFSDYKRHDCMYEFQISHLIDLFAAFSDDASAIHSASFVWNEKKRDYLLVEARGESGPVA